MLAEGLVTILILKGYGSYDDIMKMSLESAIKTFTVVYIDTLNQYLAMEKHK